MAELTHIATDGSVRMVDVSEKAVTSRLAEAAGRIAMASETAEMIVGGSIPKGNVLETARIAGIMAAKRTADVIPLCHPIAVTGVDLKFTVEADGVEVRCVVRVDERTGVEMEALTAVSVSLLTIYDMCKAVDKSMVIGEVRLIKKTGGRSGTYIRTEDTT
jgi:cyclic pyranopterin phosphate synthase